MKVLLLSNLFAPVSVGGYEAAALDTALALCDNEDLLVATSTVVSAKSRFSHLASSSETPPTTFPIERIFSIIPSDATRSEIVGLSNENWTAMKALVEGFGADVIYAWNLQWLGVARLLAKFATVPVVFHLMDYTLKGGLGLRSSFQVLRGGSSVLREDRVPLRSIESSISCSNFVRSKFRFHLSGSSHGVIYPAVPSNLPPIRQVSAGDGRIKIGYVGRPTRQKGFHLLVDAVNLLCETFPPDRLEVHYFGPAPGEFGKDLDERVRLVSRGHIGRRSVVDSLAQLDFGVFVPTWPEPFGLVQLEMLSVGIPVVSSAPAGSKELAEGVSSVLITEQNPEAVARQMREMIENLAHYQSMARIEGVKVRECLHLDRYRIEVTSILREVAS